MAHLLLKRLGAEVTHTASAHIPLARASCTAQLDARGPAKQGAGEAPALRSGRGNEPGRICLACRRCSVENTEYRTPRNEGGAGDGVAKEGFPEEVVPR